MLWERKHKDTLLAAWPDISIEVESRSIEPGERMIEYSLSAGVLAMPHTYSPASRHVELPSGHGVGRGWEGVGRCRSTYSSATSTTQRKPIVAQRSSPGHMRMNFAPKLQGCGPPIGSNIPRRNPHPRLPLRVSIQTASRQSQVGVVGSEICRARSRQVKTTSFLADDVLT